MNYGAVLVMVGIAAGLLAWVPGLLLAAMIRRARQDQPASHEYELTPAEMALLKPLLERKDTR